MEDLEWAQARLCREKAQAKDKVNDLWLKDKHIWQAIKEKTFNAFRSWWTEERIPVYLNKAVIIPLSKDKNNDAYPEHGKVRTISVLSPVYKLWELTLLKKLNDHLEENEILHPH